MALQDWFRPPRSLLTLYLAAAVATLAGVAWLAARQLGQDTLVEAERTRVRLDAAADLAVALSRQHLDRLERALAASPSDLPADVVLARVLPHAVEVLGGRPLPFVLNAVDQAEPDSGYAVAEALEFTPGGLARAADLYRAQSVGPARDVRAGALIRLARVLRRQERHAEALAAYEQLAALSDVSVEHRPADLIGLRARVRTLQDMSRHDEARAAAERVVEYLGRGRWRLPFAIWDAVLLDLQEFGPYPDSIAAELRNARRFGIALQSLPRNGTVPAIGEILDVDHEPMLRIRRETPRGAVAAIAGAEWIERVRHGLTSDRSIAVAVLTAAPHVGMGSVQPPFTLRSAADTGLPWSVVVSLARPGDAVAAARTRRRVFLIGVGGLALLVLGSGYATFRGIRRELDAARLQTEFVSAVSHEFRTPLTSIRQLSHMLQGGRIESDVRRTLYYDVLVRESERLQRLAERLLSFGRAEAGRFRFVPGDARDVTRAVVNEFGLQAAGRRLDLTLTDAVCRVSLDVEMLSLAVWNLLDNAAKYSAPERPIEVDVTTRSDRVSIMVRDHGIGISDADRVRIFDRFVRGRAPEVVATPGAGVGLAFVARVVAAHDGAVDVDSTIGRGSTFTILLPRVDA